MGALGIAIFVIAIVLFIAYVLINLQLPKKDKIKPVWLLLPLFMIIISILLMSIIIVPAGNRGIQLRFGEVSGVMGEGLNWKAPFVDTVKNISVKTQKYEIGATSASKDLQDVNTTVALNYRLTPDQVGVIYKTIGMQYIEVIANPVIQESVKQITARYDAEDMILKRADVKNEMTSAITERLAERGIVAEAVSITNFQFSDTFTQSIEAKVSAQQEILTAKNQLERIKVEAEQALAKAEGEKNARIAKAQGEAESIRIVTEAQTNANNEINSSLNSQILQYILMDRLGENINVLVIPSDMNLTLPSDKLNKFGGE